MELTEEQSSVVNSFRYRTTVESGPGSGKTATVVAWIKKRIADGCHPSSIMAITFTRKAGNELLHRLGDDCSGIWTGTFHSIAHQIVRSKNDNIKMMSPEESDALLREAGRRLGMYVGDKWKSRSNDYWRNQVDTLRSSSFCQSEFRPDRDTVRLNGLYCDLMRMGGDIDYLGSIISAAKIINDSRSLKESWRYVVVDEAQDTDEVQWKFVDTIMSDNTYGVFVGDLKQNLYSWRGARPDLFESIPDAKKLRLSKSFRNPKPVIAAANSLISRNPEGLLPITSDKEGDEVMVESWDPVMSVKYLMEMFYSPEDIAVLCRTNREADSIALALEMEDIPVARATDASQYSDIYSILSFGHRPDSVAAKSLFKEKLGITGDPMKLCVSSSPWEAAVGQSIFKCESRYANVASVLDCLSEFRFTSFDWWMENYGGHRVFDAVMDYANRSSESEVQTTGVRVMTIHQSKGLEFPAVIIPGLTQGLFPSKKSMSSISELESERRVLFVAMTRTIEKLIMLTHPGFMSQFIKECNLAYQGSEDRYGIQETDSTPF